MKSSKFKASIIKLKEYIKSVYFSFLLINDQVQNGMAGSTSCSSSRGRAHISALDAVSRVVFVLSSVNLIDEAVYSIILTGTTMYMESKTKLFVTGKIIHLSM